MEKKLSEIIKELKHIAENSTRNGYMTDDTYIELKRTNDSMQLLSTLSTKPNRFAKFDFFKKFQSNKIEPRASGEFESAVSALKPTKADLKKARKEMTEYRKAYWTQIFNDRMIRCIGEDKYKTILNNIDKNTDFLMNEEQVRKFWRKLSIEDRKKYIRGEYEYDY